VSVHGSQLRRSPPLAVMLLVVALMGGVALAGCGGNEKAKLASQRFTEGQPCAAVALEPSNAPYKGACAQAKRTEESERAAAAKREAAERQAEQRREAAEHKAEAAKTKREEEHTRAEEAHTRAQEAKEKYAEEHKGELNDHHRWAEGTRHTAVSSCEATSGEAGAARERCECEMDNTEAVESEEQLAELEYVARVEGSTILANVLRKAEEGCT
jgi:hypothetical protein